MYAKIINTHVFVITDFESVMPLVRFYPTDVVAHV